MAVEATAICCYYSHIAELRFVEQRANSGEVRSGVLCQILMQHLPQQGKYVIDIISYKSMRNDSVTDSPQRPVTHHIWLL